MTLLGTVLAFMLALGPLVVFHELGHYLVARACGVKVLRFCVGFGRVLVVRTAGPDRTEWALAAFPLGGYVKMLDEREGPVDPEQAHRAFNRQSLARRTAIVAAGPLANLLLAVLVYWGLYLNGVSDMRPVLASPPAASAAARAGLAAGDEVLAVGQRPVAGWQQLRWAMLPRAVDGERVLLHVRSAGGVEQDRVLDLSGLGADDVDADFLARCGMLLYRPPLAPVLGEVLPDRPGAQAGLQPGDRILALDGRPVTVFGDLVDAVRGGGGRPLRLRLERAGVERETVVSPVQGTDTGATNWQIGVRPRIEPDYGASMRTTVSYGLLEALGAAVTRTWETSRLTVSMIGKMIAGRVSLRNVSGPLTIADYAGQSARMGWGAYVAFVAMISISLGVLNLLPVPVLDGGHLMYYMIEGLRGRPLPEKALAWGQQVGLGALLILMAFAIYNDIHRLWGG